MTATAIALVEALAPTYGASIKVTASDRLEFSLPVPLPDRRDPLYAIVAETRGTMMTAREVMPLRLPAFCPERHINGDATFCLGWTGADALEIQDEATAHGWWARLIKFLSLQERATRLRRWPDRQVWPHGAAAGHQLRAEQAAGRLGALFVNDLREGRLDVVRRGRGAEGAGLQVRRDGTRLFAVWEELRRPVNMRQRCLCPKGSAVPPSVLRGCGDHAADTVELAFALRDRERAEAAFWASLKGQPCCGTMDGCPLGVVKKASGS